MPLIVAKTAFSTAFTTESVAPSPIVPFTILFAIHATAASFVAGLSALVHRNAFGTLIQTVCGCL